MNEDCAQIRTYVFIPTGTTLGEAALVSVPKLPLCLCLLCVLRWGKMSVTSLILWISKLPSTISVGLLGINVTQIIIIMVIFRAIMH